MEGEGHSQLYTIDSQLRAIPREGKLQELRGNYLIEWMEWNREIIKTRIVLTKASDTLLRHSLAKGKGRQTELFDLSDARQAGEIFIEKKGTIQH